MTTKRHPQRTCVVCRQKKDKRDLTRIVLTETGLQLDGSGKLNGRGAYLCNAVACWEQAASTTVLAKALRTEMSNQDRLILRQMKSS